MHDLGFVQPVDCFGEGVVVAVADAADGGLGLSAVKSRCYRSCATGSAWFEFVVALYFLAAFARSP